MPNNILRKYGCPGSRKYYNMSRLRRCRERRRRSHYQMRHHKKPLSLDSDTIKDDAGVANLMMCFVTRVVATRSLIRIVKRFFLIAYGVFTNPSLVRLGMIMILGVDPVFAFLPSRLTVVVILVHSRRHYQRRHQLLMLV